MECRERRGEKEKNDPSESLTSQLQKEKKGAGRVIMDFRYIIQAKESRKRERRKRNGRTVT